MGDERFRDVAQPPGAGFRIGAQIDVSEWIKGAPVVPPNARDGSQFSAGGSGEVVNLPGRVVDDVAGRCAPQKGWDNNPLHPLARAGSEEEGIGVPGRAVRNATAVLTERENRTMGSDDGVFREPKSKEFSEKVFHVV